MLENQSMGKSNQWMRNPENRKLMKREPVKWKTGKGKKQKGETIIRENQYAGKPLHR